MEPLKAFVLCPATIGVNHQSRATVKNVAASRRYLNLSNLFGVLGSSGLLSSLGTDFEYSSYERVFLPNSICFSLLKQDGGQVGVLVFDVSNHGQAASFTWIAPEDPIRLATVPTDSSLPPRSNCSCNPIPIVKSRPILAGKGKKGPFFLPRRL